MLFWTMLDTRIVITAALAGMACAVPGTYLVLRRQSMMGDVLSHTTLPGIVLGYLMAQALTGWFTPESEPIVRHVLLFGGAMAVGVFSAVLAEAIQQLGRVESSAALGVVLTTMFALGLLLIRVAADTVHLDPNCVLFGSLEAIAMETVPAATLRLAVMLLINGLLTVVFFKELKLAAFDPGLANALGLNARLVNYALMAVTAATVVAAFETVGSILVIAMLIVPPATAHLLTDRLSTMFGLTLLLATISAVLGHLSAIVLPPVVFGWLGFPEIRSANTAGMTAVAAGALFLLALLFAPRQGVLVKLKERLDQTLKIAREDILGLLYRAAETPVRRTVPELVAEVRGINPLLVRWALRTLVANGEVVTSPEGYLLTDAGRAEAALMIRGHRLWESFLSRHLNLADDHLHQSAERVEHYLDPALQAKLADELQGLETDPHGRNIPPPA